MYGADHRRLDQLDVGVGLDRVSPVSSVRADLRLRLADDERTRTLPLTPDFGDTQFQHAGSTDVWSRLQYLGTVGGLSLATGAEAEIGQYDVTYARPDDHSTVLSRGDGERAKLSYFAELRKRLGRRWTATSGVRADVLAFKGTGASGTTSRPQFGRLSPRLGINFAYVDGGSAAGNVYVTWTQAFKAPTLDQLYDARLLPGPSGPISLSNPQLRPQRANSYEAGLYHRLPLWGLHAKAEFAVAVYRMDLEDEIDLDLQTFRYGNILASRHDGLEASVDATLLPWLTVQHTLTEARATFRRGPRAGNRLKNMPATTFTNTARISIPHGVAVSVCHRFTGDMYLDDENTEVLPGSHLFDASVEWRVGRARVRLIGLNLANAAGGALGFLLYDPSQAQNVRQVYPRAGRRLSVAVTLE